MFNDYIWQTYLNAGGKAVVDIFENNLSNEYSEEYADFISELHKSYCPSKRIQNKFKEELLDVFAEKSQRMYVFENGDYSIESGLEILFSVISGEENLSEQRLFDFFSGSLAYYTTILAAEIPELFVPYYFQYNFNVFEKIFLISVANSN